MDLTLGTLPPARHWTGRMGLLNAVKPYVAVAAVTITGSVLVAAIYFTLLDLAWIAFLGGILVASILAMSTQAARVELHLRLTGAPRNSVCIEISEADLVLHQGDAVAPCDKSPPIRCNSECVARGRRGLCPGLRHRAAQAPGRGRAVHSGASGTMTSFLRMNHRVHGGL